MILGRGTIAQIIPDRENFIFFACGESNRFPINEERKERERARIIEWHDTKKMFVYISGLNIYYPEIERRGEYTQHKLQMEGLVKSAFENYCIFRLGSVTWGDNPNTLINSIKKKLKDTGDCEVRDVYRYLHSKEELTHWFDMIPEKGQHEMNVTGRLTWMPDLVAMLKLQMQLST